MKITGEEMLKASMVSVLAIREPNGPLEIGRKTFDSWPATFEVAGLTFYLDRIEGELTGIYFADDK